MLPALSASDRARRGWETRRKRSKPHVCSECGRAVEVLYAVPDLHPERTLCIDCAFGLTESNWCKRPKGEPEIPLGDGHAAGAPIEDIGSGSPSGLAESNWCYRR